MRINTNISAMNTYSRLTGANAKKSSSLAKLSSGLRINTAGDDAAGLSISEKMKNQISGLNQASRNAQDGISLIQTAEGALSETHSMLNRMRDLVVQAGNGTNTDDDKAAIQAELDELMDEIDNIATRTKFNGQNLMGKTVGTEFADGTFSLQVGANQGETMDIEIGDMSTGDADIANTGASAFGLALRDDTAGTYVIDVVGMDGAGKVDPDVAAQTTNDMLDAIDGAIKMVSEQRSNLGAAQNRLEHTISNLSTTKENLSEANSRIRDVDMAEEMMEFTKTNILSQASTAMLAQANQMPQGVLQLLQ